MFPPRLLEQMEHHLFWPLPYPWEMLPLASKSRLVKSQLRSKVFTIHLLAVMIIITQVRLIGIIFETVSTKVVGLNLVEAHGIQLYLKGFVIY